MHASHPVVPRNHPSWGRPPFTVGRLISECTCLSMSCSDGSMIPTARLLHRQGDVTQAQCSGVAITRKCASQMCFGVGLHGFMISFSPGNIPTVSGENLNNDDFSSFSSSNINDCTCHLKTGTRTSSKPSVIQQRQHTVRWEKTKGTQCDPQHYNVYAAQQQCFL